MFPPYYIFPYFEYGFAAQYRRPIITRPPVYDVAPDDDDITLLAYYYMVNYGR